MVFRGLRVITPGKPLYPPTATIILDPRQCDSRSHEVLDELMWALVSCISKDDVTHSRHVGGQARLRALKTVYPSMVDREPVHLSDFG